MSRGENTGPWVVRWSSGDWPRLRLFCLPYAGAGASIYRSWSSGLPAAIEICAVQLPGRERRIAEPAFTSMTSLIEPVTRALGPYLDLPFAFFGHSIGATIAYEVARRIQSERRLRPRCLLISARSAPHLPRARPPIHHLPEAQFIEELRSLNGTPDDVLASSELMQLVMPLLRADFQLAETYEHVPMPKLDCRVVAYGGADDCETSPEALAAWGEVTAAGRAVELTMFRGDHFYINTQRSALLGAIGKELLRSIE